MSDTEPNSTSPDALADAVREDRDQARRELGETVDELGRKLDVRARGKEKVNDTVHSAQQAANEAVLAAEDKAAQAGRRAKEGIARAEAKVPEPVAQSGRHAADTARRQPVPLVLGAVGAGVLVWWLLRRRRS
ncbi:Protein of uncharacterised function (DUF3618) [Nocardia farcinica]|uniref:Protein of uncharacterized function (DUF3618) n=1 Tax=Nocardia farcinica TaxID=37329 RepID=A0A449GC94_NOCFR|nr:DUF3618 domain-containing protein [Nocardia farcinica]VFA95664.1 Protein of uncharacterised function (DUF3618) [Nocardia farcinica]